MQKNPKVSIQYDKVGRFPSIPVGENTAFTIWFKALTNGTLVNNITFKAQGFKKLWNFETHWYRFREN